VDCSKKISISQPPNLRQIFKYPKAKCPVLVVAQCPFASSRLDIGKWMYTAGDSIGKAQSPSLLGAKYFWEVANSSEDVATVA
jgi:hypothetical protein